MWILFLIYKAVVAFSGIYWVVFQPQEAAAMLFANLSSSLLHMDVNKTDNEEMLSTSSTIMEGVGNILDYSSTVSHQFQTIHSQTNSHSIVACICFLRV